MGLISRLSNIFRAKANSAVSSLEDSAEVANVLVEDYAKEISVAEQAVAQFNADVKLKRIKRLELEKQLAENTQYCQKAMDAEKEDIARGFATKIKLNREQIAKLNESIVLAESKSSEMESCIRTMQESRDKARDQVSEIRSNAQINKSLNSANKILGQGSDLGSEMDRLSNKVQLETLAQESLGELRGQSKEDRELEDFKAEVNSSNVDDILNELRKK